MADICEMLKQLPRCLELKIANMAIDQILFEGQCHRDLLRSTFLHIEMYNAITLGGGHLRIIDCQCRGKCNYLCRHLWDLYNDLCLYE